MPLVAEVPVDGALHGILVDEDALASYFAMGFDQTWPVFMLADGACDSLSQT